MQPRLSLGCVEKMFGLPEVQIGDDKELLAVLGEEVVYKLGGDQCWSQLIAPFYLSDRRLIFWYDHVRQNGCVEQRVVLEHVRV